MIKRVITLVYGVGCYVVFFFTFLYAIGFLSNLGVPKSIDFGEPVSLGMPLVVNMGLLSVFAVQHSWMARPSFKRVWTRWVPEPIERSTYVLFSSLCMILLFWLWQPMTAKIWHVEQPFGAALLLGLFFVGNLLVLVSTCLINHFDLFGLRQVVLYFKGENYTPLAFEMPGIYQWVRHPLYVGWLLAFWMTPLMTLGHLLFAITTTAYILVAIQLEERNLVDYHGEDYAHYKRTVPMLIPFLRN